MAAANNNPTVEPSKVSGTRNAGSFVVLSGCVLFSAFNSRCPIAAAGKYVPARCRPGVPLEVESMEDVSRASTNYERRSPPHEARPTSNQPWLVGRSSDRRRNPAGGQSSGLCFYQLRSIQGIAEFMLLPKPSSRSSILGRKCRSFENRWRCMESSATRARFQSPPRRQRGRGAGWVVAVVVVVAI